MNSFFFLVIIVLIFLLKCIVVCLPDHDPEGDGVATHGAVDFFFEIKVQLVENENKGY